MKITSTFRISGLTAAAKTLGVSKTHLSAVIRGDRVSRRLTEKAKELGIKFPKIKGLVRNADIKKGAVK